MTHRRDADPLRERPLILASGSPQRLALLSQLGLSPTVIVPAIDETRRRGESPATMVERLAAGKAAAVIACTSGDQFTVLAADTAIVLDGEPLGKPADRTQAIAMLSALSGRTHRVLTAIVVRTVSQNLTTTVASKVRFTRIDRRTAAAYWETGEPIGKAGAYAVQGRGAAFVERLTGSYSNVVGLPLFETANLLRQTGIFLFDPD